MQNLIEVKNQKLKIINFMLLLGFCLSVLYYYLSAVYSGQGYPANTYLYIMNDQFPNAQRVLGDHVFSDFFAPWMQTKQGNPYEIKTIFFASNYFPVAHVLLKPFTWFSYRDAVYLFLLCAFAIAAGFAHSAFRGKDWYLNANNMLVFGLLAYPMQMIYDRGNIEIFVFLFVWLFFAALQKQKYYWSAFFLAVAAGMKIYPAFFAILYLKKDRIKPLLAFVGLFIGLCCLSLLLLFKGDMAGNLPKIYQSFQVYADHSHAGIRSLSHNSSLVSFYQLLYILYYKLTTVNFDVYSSQLFLALISLVITAGLIAAKRRNIYSFWEKITILTTILLLLLPGTPDYRLIYLYIPLALFINQETAWHKTQKIILVLFALIFLPKNQIILNDIGISTLVNPLLLLMLLGILTFKSVSTKKQK